MKRTIEDVLPEEWNVLITNGNSASTSTPSPSHPPMSIICFFENGCIDLKHNHSRSRKEKRHSDVSEPNYHLDLSNRGLVYSIQTPVIQCSTRSHSPSAIINDLNTLDLNKQKTKSPVMCDTREPPHSSGEDKENSSFRTSPLLISSSEIQEIDEGEPEWLLEMKDRHNKIIRQFDERIAQRNDYLNQLAKQIKAIQKQNNLDARKREEVQTIFDQEINEKFRQWLAGKKSTPANTVQRSKNLKRVGHTKDRAVEQRLSATFSSRSNFFGKST